MRKSIAFVAGLVLLAAVLAGTGCKPRDAKKAALAMMPSPASNPCAVSNFMGTIGMDQWCRQMYYDTYDSDDLFADCGGEYGSPEQVFAINIPYAMTVNIVAVGEGYPCLTVRRNCDPNDEGAIVDGALSPGASELYVYLEPGTYYVVIESLYGPFEYWWGLCDSLPDHAT